GAGRRRHLVPATDRPAQPDRRRQLAAVHRDEHRHPDRPGQPRRQQWQRPALGGRATGHGPGRGDGRRAAQRLQPRQRRRTGAAGVPGHLPVRRPAVDAGRGDLPPARPQRRAPATSSGRNHGGLIRPVTLPPYPITPGSLSVSVNAFSSLPLSAAMQANLAAIGYSETTPIQAASLPLILKGRDLIAQAKTGSGKTAAFGIGLLHPLNPRYFGCQALVLCPTRELADQVAKELRRLARAADNIKILTLCG